MTAEARTDWWNEADPVARERGRQKMFYRSALKRCRSSWVRSSLIANLSLAAKARQALLKAV